MMPDFWLWNNKFRVAGVLTGVAFHVVMFALAFSSSDPHVGGYRWMFLWYMPAMVLGLPWSIAAMFLGAIIPGVNILGLIVAVCFNGYLLGWPIDKIANRSRRVRQSRIIDSYLNATPDAPLPG